MFNFAQPKERRAILNMENNRCLLEAKHGGLSGSSGRPKRIDYGALVVRLIDKSDAGKLPWKPVAETRHFSLTVVVPLLVLRSAFLAA